MGRAGNGRQMSDTVPVAANVWNVNVMCNGCSGRCKARAMQGRYRLPMMSVLGVKFE